MKLLRALRLLEGKEARKRTIMIIHQTKEKMRKTPIPELKTPPHLGNNFDTTAERTKEDRKKGKGITRLNGGANVMIINDVDHTPIMSPTLISPSPHRSLPHPSSYWQFAPS